MAHVLMVEGATEKRLIPEFIEKRGIDWEPSPKKYLVDINQYGGFTQLVAPNEIETALKTSQLKALGIVFDADELHEGSSNRWLSVSDRLKEIGLNPPTDIPKDGLILSNEAGLKIGVWMMPNNKTQGMLETFTLSLVPKDLVQQALLSEAKRAIRSAKSKGAPFKSIHEDKALIHTWLAWQDPPGVQLHQAVKFNLFDSQNEAATPFYEWFIKLFGVSES